ncbi:hypothetical protein BB559_003838, partial [Furculomyces boomerangus]
MIPLIISTLINRSKFSFTNFNSLTKNWVSLSKTNTLNRNNRIFKNIVFQKKLYTQIAKTYNKNQLFRKQRNNDPQHKFYKSIRVYSSFLEISVEKTLENQTEFNIESCKALIDIWLLFVSKRKKENDKIKYFLDKAKEQGNELNEDLKQLISNKDLENTFYIFSLWAVSGVDSNIDFVSFLQSATKSKSQLETETLKGNKTLEQINFTGNKAHQESLNLYINILRRLGVYEELLSNEIWMAYMLNIIKTQNNLKAFDLISKYLMTFCIQTVSFGQLLNLYDTLTTLFIKNYNQTTSETENDITKNDETIKDNNYRRKRILEINSIFSDFLWSWLIQRNYIHNPETMHIVYFIIVKSYYPEDIAVILDKLLFVYKDKIKITYNLKENSNILKCVSTFLLLLHKKNGEIYERELNKWWFLITKVYDENDIMEIISDSNRRKNDRIFLESLGTTKTSKENQSDFFLQNIKINDLSQKIIEFILNSSSGNSHPFFLNKNFFSGIAKLLEFRTLKILAGCVFSKMNMSLKRLFFIPIFNTLQNGNNLKIIFSSLGEGNKNNSLVQDFRRESNYSGINFLIGEDLVDGKQNPYVMEYVFIFLYHSYAHINLYRRKILVDFLKSTEHINKNIVSAVLWRYFSSITFCKSNPNIQKRVEESIYCMKVLDKLVKPEDRLYFSDFVLRVLRKMVPISNMKDHLKFFMNNFVLTESVLLMNRSFV